MPAATKGRNNAEDTYPTMIRTKMFPDRQALPIAHIMPSDTYPNVGMMSSMYGTTHTRRVRNGVNITSKLDGNFLRMYFSTIDITKTPQMTARTPPLPLLSTERNGTALSYRPSNSATASMFAMDVIMPNMPPRIGVAPNRSAAR